MNVTVGLAQIQPKIGDVCANLKKHLEQIAAAKAHGVDLLLFPELSLTGYNLQDLVYEVASQPTADDPAFRDLLQASADYQMDLMVGFVDTDNRARYFIAAAYLSGGQVLHVHHKVYLPTYTMFDEGRYFAWGDSVQAFDTRFGRVGMLICEDFWHASPPYLLWLDRAVPQRQPRTRPRCFGSTEFGALGAVGQSGVWQPVHELHYPLQPRWL